MALLGVVSSGIDSLYVSAKGELFDGLLDWLRSMRELGGTEATAFAFHPDEASFLLRPHGWRGYPFWLGSPRFEVMVGSKEPFPPVYVQLHSAFLHTLGAEDAIHEVSRVLARHFLPNGFRLGVSRIDVYADTQGWAPTVQHFETFVCRAVRRRMYCESAQLHGFGRRISGFTFGKGDLVARLYDKTLELTTRGQTWPSIFWKDADRAAPVWRIEFQFRRPALTSMGLREPTQTVAMRQSLWEYGTRWLSLRVPTEHAKRSRWPEHPVWLDVREAEIGLPASEVVREHVQRADQQRLVSGFVGYTSSLAAMTGERDVQAAVRRAVPLATHYLHERGIAFSDIVERKQSLRRATR